MGASMLVGYSNGVWSLSFNASGLWFILFSFLLMVGFFVRLVQSWKVSLSLYLLGEL